MFKSDPSTALMEEAFPAPARAHAIQRFRSKKVLLVDDDNSVLSLLGETIVAMGHKVVIAHDGPHALRLLLRHRSIDCLFTDVVMPNGMSGVQLMAAARAVRPGLPAVIASSYPREEVYAMGGIPSDVNFIAKPYLLTDLYPLLDGASTARRTRAARRKEVVFL
jgi:DNA-binding NtrC family response regulator